MRRAVEHALAAHPGDVLVFLPGQREIDRAMQLLAPTDAADGVEVLALHGDLPVDQQSRVLQPASDGRRRVVLATNVAESSVTLPGVRVVIDSGLAREPRYDPNSGFSRLDAVAISQASADQRAGRAGRVAAGWAYRLWPQSQRLEPQRRAEIAQVELAGLALELAAWGSDALRFVDPPPPGALAAARDLLQRLGALDARRAHHRIRAGACSRSARIRGWRRCCWRRATPSERALACDLAALLEARDPLRASPAPRSDAIADRWRRWRRFARARRRATRIAARWRRSTHAAAAVAPAPARATRRRRATCRRTGSATCWCTPSPIASRASTPAEPRRYQLANGRMARLFDDSALYGEPWLVVSELRDDARDAPGAARRAAGRSAAARAISRSASPNATSCAGTRTARAGVATRTTLRRASCSTPRPAAASIRRRLRAPWPMRCANSGCESLPWSEALSQWRARVQSLRAWLPELADALPDLSDAALLASARRVVAAGVRPARRGWTHWTRRASREALRASLDWSGQQRLDALAPVRIAVPSGMERRIEYAVDAHGVRAAAGAGGEAAGTVRAGRHAAHRRRSRRG